MASPQSQSQPQPQPLPSFSDVHEFYAEAVNAAAAIYHENHPFWFPPLEPISSSPPPPPSPPEYKLFDPPHPSFPPSSSSFESETKTFVLAVNVPLPPNGSSTFASEDPNPQYLQFNYDGLLPFGDDATAYYDGCQIAEYAPIVPTPPPAAAADIEAAGGSAAAAFECRICLRMAKQAVVTACGHLYCWPCLYKWMSHSWRMIKECPSCRDQINENFIFPILGGNDEEQMEPDIPPRPRCKRTCANGFFC